MINEFNKDEYIERYLLGKLTGEDLVVFKERLASEEEFRREVALQKAVVPQLYAAGRKEWKAKLEVFEKELVVRSLEGNVSPKKVPYQKRLYEKKYLFRIAAIFILAILTTILLLLKEKPANNKQIFLAYYKPYVSIEPTSRTPLKATAERNLAFGAYESKNYKESIERFKSLLNKGQDEVVLFYLGNAYLSEDKPELAEETFNSYLSHYREFEFEAKWYLSLSYIKQGKLKEAKSLLKDLTVLKNDYSNFADEILKKL